MLHLLSSLEQEVCQPAPSTAVAAAETMRHDAVPRWNPGTPIDKVPAAGGQEVNDMNAAPRSPWAVVGLAALLLAASSTGAEAADAQDTAAACPGPRPHAFWEGVERGGFALPPGTSAAELLDELQPCLASPDPKLRDNLVYEATAAWMYRDKRLSDAEVRKLLATWVANLRLGLGEEGTDSVLRRSFSALCLSIVAALDNARPFLERSEFASLLRAALDYLAGEKDVRGFEPGKGWIHSAAHTADLLKFLARSRHLLPAEQPLVLDAIGAKLEAAGQVFTHGENERLARAVASLARRADLDGAAFDRWLSGFTARHKQLWEAPEIDPLRLAAEQNGKDLLRSLFVELVLDAGPERAGEGPRGRVLECLRNLAA